MKNTKNKRENTRERERERESFGKFEMSEMKLTTLKQMGRERTDACPKSETKIRKLRIGGTKVLKRTVASHKSRKDNS